MKMDQRHLLTKFGVTRDAQNRGLTNVAHRTTILPDESIAGDPPESQVIAEFASFSVGFPLKEINDHLLPFR
jgi:hypothetical protein